MTATEQPDRVPTSAWRCPAVVAGVVFLVALLVRVIHLRQMAAAPFFNVLTGDGVAYDAWARRIAAGDWLGEGVFYQAPLYPYFVGVVYSLFSDSLPALRLVQITLGSAAAALLADATRRWFGPVAGWTAGLVLALCPTAIFFESLVQKTVLDTVLLAVLLNLLSRTSGGWGRVFDAPASAESQEPGLRGLSPSHPASRRRAALWAGVGVTAGLLVLSRENALILVPPLIAWALLADRVPAFPAGRRAVWAGAFVAGLSLTLLPVVARNKIVGGEFHLTTSQFGSNLFMGNNPTAIGTYTAFRPGRGDARYERTDATELASAGLGRPADQPLSPREVSRYWTGRTLAYIREQPGHWLNLMARKCLIVVNRVEVVDTDDQYTWSEWSAVLRWPQPLLNFGVLMPLAVAGAVLAWRRQPAVRWLVLLWLVYAAGVVVFYILSRYRFPLVPLLIPLAAAGVAGIAELVCHGLGATAWPRLRGKPCRGTETTRFAEVSGGGQTVAPDPVAPTGPGIEDSAPATRTFTVAAIAAIVAAGLAHWPIVPMAAMRASGLLTAGNAIEARDPAAALTYYDRASALWPRSAELQFSRGNALATLGRHDQAVQAYCLSIEANPGFAPPRYALARSLQALGQPDGLSLYQQLIERIPDDPIARLHFSHLLSQQDRFDDAAAQLTRALELRSDWPEALNARGIAHARAGRLEPAILDFEQALRLNPDLTDARDNLARARAMPPTTPP